MVVNRLRNFKSQVGAALPEYTVLTSTIVLIVASSILNLHQDSGIFGGQPMIAIGMALDGLDYDDPTSSDFPDAIDDGDGGGGGGGSTERQGGGSDGTIGNDENEGNGDECHENIYPIPPECDCHPKLNPMPTECKDLNFQDAAGSDTR